MNLTTALDIFTDNLPEIKEALVDNMSHDIDQLGEAPWYEDPTRYWISVEVHKIRAALLTDERMKIVRRIVGRLEARAKPMKYKNRITEDDIQRAREFPIEDMYEDTLRGGGSGRKCGRCPFHQERTPSFYIHLKDNRWSCFGACGEHGDSISFYAKLHGLDMNKDFIKIVRILSRK